MNRLFVSTLLLFAAGSSCVYGQGAQRVSTALGNVNSQARILAYAQVKVCTYDSAHPTNCTTTVTLYQDPALSIPYSSNPIQADKNGNYSYWVTPGNYVEQMCATGSQCQTQVVTLGGANGGANLPHTNDVIAGDGAGNGIAMPEKPTTLVSGSPNTATVQCDEDWSHGRFDPRCPAYAGGVYGGTIQAAWQAFSDRLICYESMTGNHPHVQLPPGNFPVGTPTQPTLKFPTGVIWDGGGGWGFGTTSIEFDATYNAHTAVEFDSGLTSTTNCSDGSPHTANLNAGSYDGFSEHGCGQGGCSNAPSDSGNYPFGGPTQVGIAINDADASIAKKSGVFARNNGGDGIIIGGQDSHTYELGGSDNNEYFYFGLDVAGQNYQFSGVNEVHGDVVLGGLDNMNEGPTEVYGTTMTLGWEYGHIAGVVLGGGNVSMGTYFSQIEEIGVILAGGGGTARTRIQPGRVDASRGDGIRSINSGNSTILSPVIISACRFDGANDYLVASVVTATPGSGQTPGTYTVTGSDGTSQIIVVVTGAGTVTANPTVSVHSRAMSNTPPTYTLAAGGTPATFTATMVNVFAMLVPIDVSAPICDYISERSTGANTWVGPHATNDTFFGTDHSTGDYYTNSASLFNSWVSPKGNGTFGNAIWDPQPAASIRAASQSIINPDYITGNGGTVTTGAALNIGTTGGHIRWSNASPTTISTITGGYMGQFLEMRGDGFTTLPYIPTPETTAFGVGAVTCTGYPLLLEANRWYRFQITGGQLFGFPMVLSEQCDSIDQNHWWVNHTANSGTLPPLVQQGQIDSIGDIRSHAIPALAALTGQSGGTPGANGVGGTYTYTYRVWGPWGTQTSGALSFNQCLPLPGFVNNPCFQNVTWTIPEGTTHVQVFRETSTDGVATAGMVFEQTWTAPQHSVAQTYLDTRVAPINANIIGSANFNANMTGGPWECGTLPPVSAYPAVIGQRCDSPATGKRYWADAADHWKITSITYANF